MTYLDRRGEDLEVLYEKCDWPAEFLRDPSSWLEADKMEALLRSIDFEYGRSPALEEELISIVGHQCKDLRAWGVLDSVLRMVQAPKDLFAQPERFLSYFISPAPPVGEVRRGPDSVSFVLPVSEIQFPFVTRYLRSALEALPTYINEPTASVKWENSRVTISWSEQQVSLFSETHSTELSLHPELVRNILMNLESSQTQLEELKRQLGERDEEIARLKSIQPPVERRPLAVSGTDISLLAQGVSREVALPISQVLNELYRLGDYLARGQQMVTLLIGQGRQTPQVQEAMRRVDWAFVSGEGPQVVKRAVAGLQEVQASLQDLQLIARAEGQESNDVVFGIEADRVPSDLNDLVVRAIETVKARTSAGTSGGVQIDRHLLLDRPVRVNPLRFEQAVVNLLSNAVESLEGGGVVRVLTRPRGARAEIEITDTGCGMEDSVLARAIEPFFTTKPAPSTGLGLSLANSIVRLHDGGLSIASRPGSGSTVLIDLPLTN